MRPSILHLVFLATLDAGCTIATSVPANKSDDPPKAAPPATSTAPDPPRADAATPGADAGTPPKDAGPSDGSSASPAAELKYSGAIKFSRKVP